jgi:hypothetical protein
MSILKRLFGLGGGSSGGGGAPEAVPVTEHLGFTIRAVPYREGGQWQLCGEIAKEIGGETRIHRFIRADRFTDRDTAVEMTFLKGRLIVEQSGDRIFD